MLRAFTKAILTTALLTVCASAKEKLCALPTASLTAAAEQYPELASSLELVRNEAIATWYTDRESAETCADKVKDIIANCDEDTRVTLVVNGLPNKDCEAEYSAGGANKNADDYKKWVQQLADGVGQRKVLYVLEPEAIGLLAKGGCGVDNGYAENLKAALEILSQNPNADIYADVGYQTLLDESDATAIAKTVKELASAGRLKGIALNTSNFRSNEQISELCANFQKAYGDDTLHCIADTSRNYNTSPLSVEWCNPKFAGIGHPPTDDTGFDNLDYFIWIKPAGESDGTCDGSGYTDEALVGPSAGSFFKEHFVNLWNNGYYVNEKKLSKIGESTDPDTPATVSPTAPEPTSSTPEPTIPISSPPVESSQPPVTPDPESDSPIANPSLQTPTQTPTEAPTPVENEEESSPTPVASLPATSSVPVAAFESGERASDLTPEPTPVPTPAKTKKTKKAKKCESGLEPLPEEGDLTPGEVKTPTESNTTSTTVNDAREAPGTDGIEIGNAPAQAANTKSDANEASGMSGGVFAVVVIAGVAALAVAAVVFRRQAEERRRANTLRTPVENFGELRATPAQVTVL